MEKFTDTIGLRQTKLDQAAPPVVRGITFQDVIGVLDETNDSEYKQQNIAT